MNSHKMPKMLPTVNGYTIDLRLGEARLADPEARLEFHNLRYPDSEKAWEIRDAVIAFCMEALLTLT